MSSSSTRAFASAANDKSEHSKNEKADTAEEQETKSQGKIKRFIKEYGPIGIATYFGVCVLSLVQSPIPRNSFPTGLYGLTLASFYALFASGYVPTPLLPPPPPTKKTLIDAIIILSLHPVV
jgi:hypothetical protein